MKAKAPVTLQIELHAAIVYVTKENFWLIQEVAVGHTFPKDIECTYHV